MSLQSGPTLDSRLSTPDSQLQTLSRLLWSGREADAPLQTPRSQAVTVLPG
ncbi:MAG: hypothetical protein ACRD8U_06980 [Pyrinomonadaceae bacterium]